MKKTLIALAVLAASGASFAQVSVTGKLGFSIQKSAEVAGGSANQGMQMADGDINFAAKEDLGGGMSITAKQAFQLRGRDTPVTARDASLTLASGMTILRFINITRISIITNRTPGIWNTAISYFIRGKQRNLKISRPIR